MYTRGTGEGNTTFWVEVEVREGGRQGEGEREVKGGEGGRGRERKENREE